MRDSGPRPCRSWRGSALRCRPSSHGRVRPVVVGRGMIVIVAMAVVVRMMMALVDVIVTVLMGMAGPIGMNMLVLLASADERRDFGRTARSKIGQRRGRRRLGSRMSRTSDHLLDFDALDVQLIAARPGESSTSRKSRSSAGSAWRILPRMRRSAPLRRSRECRGWHPRRPCPSRPPENRRRARPATRLTAVRSRA